MVSNIAFQFTLLGLVVAIGITFMVIIGVFFTGIGKRIIQRMRQRFQYKSGKYVNVIFIRNNHVADERFIPKEADGSFKIDEKRYIVNPLCTFNHDGIPTQVNFEGTTEPFNIFNLDDAQAMSTAEIEKIIMNNEVGDIVALLKRLFPLLLILLIVVVLFICVSLYFNWKIYDALVQKDVIRIALETAKKTVEVTPR